MCKNILLPSLLFVVGFLFLSPARVCAFSGPGIEWLSFEQAVARNDRQPKKIFIDVYTDWCGWCKKMDASTFQHPVIQELMGKYFYAVKLDAETKDTIRFRNELFTASGPGRKPSNTLAVKLLNGKMSYPTTVYMDSSYGILSPVPGYLTADVLEKILVFYGENHYLSRSWEEFQKTFIGQIQPNQLLQSK